MSEALPAADRSLNYHKQIKFGAVFRLTAIFASFLAVPTMIRTLGVVEFGIWSTLLSILNWISFFDLGVGNGLRNKVAISLSGAKQKIAAAYISTGYMVVGASAVVAWLIAILLIQIISLQTIFNTVAISETTLKLLFHVVSAFVFVNFWLSLVNSILGACQMTSWVYAGQMASNVMFLGALYALEAGGWTRIEMVGLSYGLASLIANIFITGMFFWKRQELRPRFKFVPAHTKSLFSVGLGFFVIQVAGLVIFMSDKFLITQLVGPEAVASYDVVFKLFNVVTIGHAMILAPLWSAYTEASVRGDRTWIKRTLRKQIVVLGIVAAAIACQCIATPFILVLWVKDMVQAPTLLVWSMGLFVLICAWNGVFATYLNGIGALKVQIWTSVIVIFAHVPLAVIGVKVLGFGASGVVLASCVGLMLPGIALPAYARKKLRGVTQ